MGRGEDEERTVYIGNLSWSTSWQDLKDHMKDCGHIEYCDVIMNSKGKSAGYGLARYADSRDAERAIEKLTDTELDGRKIFVREDREGGYIDGGGKKGGGKSRKGKRSREFGSDSDDDDDYRPRRRSKGGKGSGKKGGKSDEWSIWVGPLRGDESWQDLKDAFAKYNPTHTDVGDFRGGENRGFGIVKFATATDAEAAINKVYKVGRARVECKWDNEMGKGKGGKRSRPY